MAREALRLKRLKRLLQLVQMGESAADFDNCTQQSNIIIEPKRVTAFIRERTKLWRETWVIPIVKDLLDEERDRLGNRRHREAMRKKSKQ